MPGILYLPTGLCYVTRSAYDHVGQADLLALRRLRIHALPGLLKAERPSRHQAFNLLVCRTGRHPQCLAGMVPARFDQFDRFDDDHRRLSLANAVSNLATHRRMYNLLQAPQLGRVFEHNAPQTVPSDLAVSVDHVGAKSGDDLVIRRPASLHHLVGNLVGVDHCSPQFGQHRCNRALAGRDVAGQTNQIWGLWGSGHSATSAQRARQACSSLST